MLEQELEVSVRARRWALVVDPLLALTSPLGAQLVQRLGTVADLWVVRSFWQVLDSSEFYRRDALAFWPESARAALPPAAGGDIAQALDLWEGARTHADRASCHLNWVSDNLTESSFAEGAPADLIERYELMHQTLSLRGDLHDESIETAGFFGAMDALALTAALGAVRLLTLAADHPLSCLARACELLRLPIETPRRAMAELVGIERDHFHQLIVQAGASALMWAGPPLALVQLAVPRAVFVEAPAFECVADSSRALDTEFGDEATQPRPHDPWDGAKAYFHGL